MFLLLALWVIWVVYATAMLVGVFILAIIAVLGTLAGAIVREPLDQAEKHTVSRG